MKVFVIAMIVAAATARPLKVMHLHHNEKPELVSMKISSRHLSVLHSSVAEEVNKMETTWKAGVNSRFANADDSFIRQQMGTFLDAPYALPVNDAPVAQDIPASFDSRDQWGSICPSTKEVRDQAACGSCWAFGAVEAMTDRICIASKGQQQPHISAEDLLTCNVGAGSCSGGFPISAWEHFVSDGIVTGGQYGTKEGCQPYTLPHCDHHVSGQYPSCSGEGPTPRCKRQCIAEYNVTYTQDKHKGKTAYSVRSDVEAIQTEIMTYGPVEGAFTVYNDFLTYKSGVYKHVTGQALGGHAIKIIGWGTDNGEDYWTVANSWNEDWGDQGFFKIARGNDECGIESGIVAGHV